MDVTNAAPSAAFTLDAQATPASFHRFIRAQPAASHVTIEFRVPRDGGGIRIPVVRVAHIGERDVFTDDSRAALWGKLREWNEELLGKPGAKEAAEMLNELFRPVEDLSLDVGEIDPALQAMSDAYCAAHPTSMVRAWRENEAEVMRILAPDDPGRDANRIAGDRKSVGFALKMLSRFREPASNEFDAVALQEETWQLCRGLSKGQRQMLHDVSWLIETKKNDPRLQRFIGPEVKPLLELCRDAKGTELADFKASPDNKTLVFAIMEALRDSAHGSRDVPDSRSLPNARESKNEKERKPVKRRGSMPMPFISMEPMLSSPAKAEGEGKDAGQGKKKTTPPKSARQRNEGDSTGNQTLKETPKRERLPLRRVQTDVEEPASGSTTVAALVSPRAPRGPAISESTPSATSSEAHSERKKRKLDRAATVSPGQREDAEAGAALASERKSGAEKSSHHASSGKREKSGSKKPSPEDRQKTRKKTPRDTQRARSGDSPITRRAVETTTNSTTTSTTTVPMPSSPDASGRSKGPRSKNPHRLSQPVFTELQERLAMEKFNSTREESITPLAHQAARHISYAPRDDGKYYLEWCAYVEDHPAFSDEAAEQALKLLSYFPELPENDEALNQVVRDVVRSARLNRTSMELVLMAAMALSEDKEALERSPALRKVCELLDLALRYDNKRRVDNGHDALY